MTALRHHAKRDDDGFDRVIVLRRHTSKPFPRACCCPVLKDHTDTPKASETSFRPVDMHQLRRAFPERWGEYCRTHHRSAEDLALFMGVDERTARYWMEGKHAPAAPFVLRAVTAFPDAAAMLLGEDF